MLQLKDIKKNYKVGDGEVSALKGVNLAFRRNEFVSILGASGCGKTTLLNIIGGLDHYTSGDLVIDGVSTKDFKDGDWDTYRNHRIGFVFQSYNLIPHQTVLGNVELALTLSGVSAKERKERAKEALERVGLGKEINKRPNQLSGGQMQRVAIARALVNNPEILLADEPTGALDTNTSVQIMELIKEIAGERLVIMVTHNPELAQQYSTRIVELKDGFVINDSAPYSAEEEAAEVAEHIRRQNELSARAAAGGAPSHSATPLRKKKKTSMSFVTAFALSGKNLLTKKARTIITSVAGSIGIISVCLVLALSNGFSNYIKQTEEDMLSYYPITISETSLDLTSVMSSFMGGTSLNLDNIEDKVYVNSLLTQLAKGMTTSNDISSSNVANINGTKTTYLEYIESMPENLYNAIQYSYGVSVSANLFTDVTIGSTTTQISSGTYGMSLEFLREYYTYLLTSMASEYSSLTSFISYFTDVVSVMPDSKVSEDGFNWNNSYISSQYDVIAGSMPSSSDEIVLVVGSSNDVLDLTLVQLGLLSEEEFLNLFSSESDVTSTSEIDFDDVLGKEYTLYYNDAVFTEKKDTDTGTSASKKTGSDSKCYQYKGYTTENATVSDGEGRTLKISGILKLKDELTYGCLEEGLCFTESLLEEYIEANMKSEIVKMLKSAEDSSAAIESIYDYTITSSGLQSTQRYSTTSTTLDAVIRELGGDNTPNGISIYARDFNTKDELLSYLDKWNTYVAEARADYEANGTSSVYSDESGEYIGPTEVTYTDTVGTLMSLVDTILNAVTYVLVAFTAISLVVSTVMIGVITYVSVVERIKEIGILRSIGARKRDIRHVFNAETFIVGLCAGLIGVIVAYLLQVVINLVITPLTGISNLAALPVWEAFIMVCVSVVLTLISGLIPASTAAKKDPVIALRSD